MNSAIGSSLLDNILAYPGSWDRVKGLEFRVWGLGLRTEG